MLWWYILGKCSHLSTSFRVSQTMSEILNGPSLSWESADGVCFVNKKLWKLRYEVEATATTTTKTTTTDKEVRVGGRAFCIAAIMSSTKVLRRA